MKKYTDTSYRFGKKYEEVVVDNDWPHISLNQDEVTSLNGFAREVISLR